MDGNSYRTPTGGIVRASSTAEFTGLPAKVRPRLSGRGAGCRGDHRVRRTKHGAVAGHGGRVVSVQGKVRGVQGGRDAQ